MRAKGGIVYIFDIDNKQEEYSECLEFISVLLDKELTSTPEKKLQRIRELVTSMRVSGARVPTYARNYYEQPIEINGSVVKPLVVGAKRVLSENIRPEILNLNPSQLYVHIRIHIGRDMPECAEMTNLQYLALLLQRTRQLFAGTNTELASLPDWQLLRRISVFIVPNGMEYYPFSSPESSVDCNSYKVVSHYLRLLSKAYTGIIYGVVKHGTQVSVKALNFQITGKFAGHFPLIPLNNRTYPELFERFVSHDFISDLFSLQRNRRFRDAANNDPYKAMSSFMAEAAFNQLRDSLSNLSVSARTCILNWTRDELIELSKNRKLNIMLLSIYLFTLGAIACGDRDERDKSGICPEIKTNLEFARELSDGLRQIAQNTLQHSVNHEGFFSFYLSGNATRELYIYISDFNNRQSFIDNFTSNLLREAAHTDNSNLKKSYLDLAQHRENINMGWFFGEYGNSAPDIYWRNFRASDTSAHIGLILFSLAIQRCKGFLTLTNSINYFPDEKYRFSYNYGCGTPQGVENDLSRCDRVIPGTQLFVKIPVGSITRVTPTGLGQLSPNGNLVEDYCAFAKYLEYEAKEIDFDGKVFTGFSELNAQTATGSEYTIISNADQKYRLIYFWEKYWRRHWSGKRNPKDVYFMNISKLPSCCVNTADQAEVFIKGFINSIYGWPSDQQESYLAMTNVPPHFFHCVRQLAISLAPMRFPSWLQLYIVGKEPGNNFLLLGDSFRQAVENAVTLSLEYGSSSFSFDERDRARLLDLRINIGVSGGDVSMSPRLVCPFDAILRASENDTLSLFDSRICAMANRPIDSSIPGYKLENVHMRLGSKVHTRAFYEMAFLFYRTGIANRIAFEILRSMLRDCASSIDLEKDNVLFYGYASYSKALLTSMLEILKQYRFRKASSKAPHSFDKMQNTDLISQENYFEEISSHLAMGSFQHNLQSEFQSEKTEMFFNFSGTTIGENIRENEIKVNSPVKVVQIVPISSTLTTFEKMERRLYASCLPKNGRDKLDICQKYTVFWVTDAGGEGSVDGRTNLEKRYWNSVSSESRQICLFHEVGVVSAPIKYIMRCTAKWDDPLECELCYPDDLIGEIPLVETDHTSTVPAQQIRGEERTDTFRRTPPEQENTNDKRLISLRSLVHYGHIRREKNHF